MRNIRFICVDFQKEFSTLDGKCYRPRPCVEFIKNTLCPFFREKNLKMAEIISDYRQPRPGDRGDSNYPDTEGYISEIPEDVKIKPEWVKCMNSPIWTRKNIGKPDKPSLPYQDPSGFVHWLHTVIGKPSEVDRVIVLGLTLDCCVFCLAQELNWQAYKVQVLVEAVDTYSGGSEEKELILNHPPLLNWAKPIFWDELRKTLI
ncbi:MAG: hypothetical protein AABX70_05410 [Nanoarchaeota archaeon]